MGSPPSGGVDAHNTAAAPFAFQGAWLGSDLGSIVVSDDGSVRGKWLELKSTEIDFSSSICAPPGFVNHDFWTRVYFNLEAVMHFIARSYKNHTQ